MKLLKHCLRSLVKMPISSQIPSTIKKCKFLNVLYFSIDDNKNTFNK